MAAEPYETVAFKLQSREVDRSQGVLLSNLPGSKVKEEPATWSHWDPDVKTYSEWAVVWHDDRQRLTVPCHPSQPSRSCSGGSLPACIFISVPSNPHDSALTRLGSVRGARGGK